MNDAAQIDAAPQSAQGAEGVFDGPALQALSEALSRHSYRTLWALGPVTLELRVAAINGLAVGPGADGAGAATQPPEPTASTSRRGDSVAKPAARPQKHPEFFADLIGIVARALEAGGLDAARACTVAESVAEEVRDQFGGQIVYIPKCAALRTRERWARIWDAFDGRNHGALARQYGMGIHAIYKAIAYMRAEHAARAQPSLFDTTTTTTEDHQQ
ncbi:MAG: hypothetical protein MUF16_00140 [Burkholderiaceae bacterium]|jgi:Mor family transcriptional regulator|nr:hypothetical protein [Burkholderiaceae bacterium]